MSLARSRRWLRALYAVAGCGLVFQQGCAVDPDLLLQAGVQFATEFAIFLTDSALVGLR